MVDPTGLRYQKNTRMLNPAPKNVGGWVPKPPKILPPSSQDCDEGRGLYRWPETTNIYNMREAANSDTSNVIQHNRWVYQFVALRFKRTKRKKRRKNVSPTVIKPLRRLNPQRNSDFWKETSNMPFSRWKKTRRPTVSVFWTVLL